MNPTQIGFLLILGAVLAGSAVVGFRVACKHKDPFGTFRPSFVALYAVLAYLWHTGTLAAFPSFVQAQGSNAFIAFPVLMMAVTAILAVISTLLWCGLFLLLRRAAEACDRYMAVR